MLDTNRYRSSSRSSTSLRSLIKHQPAALLDASVSIIRKLTGCSCGSQFRRDWNIFVIVFIYLAFGSVDFPPGLCWWTSPLRERAIMERKAHTIRPHWNLDKEWEWQSIGETAPSPRVGSPRLIYVVEFVCVCVCMEINKISGITGGGAPFPLMCSETASLITVFSRD